MSRSYSEDEEFFWDDHKNERVKREHSIDLRTAARVFDDPNAWMREGLYKNIDGSIEEQYRTVGIVDGRVITVASKDENDCEKIITAWDSSREEIQGYRENNVKESRVRRRKMR